MRLLVLPTTISTAFFLLLILSTNSHSNPPKLTRSQSCPNLIKKNFLSLGQLVFAEMKGSDDQPQKASQALSTLFVKGSLDHKITAYNPLTLQLKTAGSLEVVHSQLTPEAPSTVHAVLKHQINITEDGRSFLVPSWSDEQRENSDIKAIAKPRPEYITILSPIYYTDAWDPQEKYLLRSKSDKSYINVLKKNEDHKTREEYLAELKSDESSINALNIDNSRKWKFYKKITTNNPVNSVFFSSDGRHIITVDNHSKSKIHTNYSESLEDKTNTWLDIKGDSDKTGIDFRFCDFHSYRDSSLSLGVHSTYLSNEFNHSSDGKTVFRAVWKKRYFCELEGSTQN